MQQDEPVVQQLRDLVPEHGGDLLAAWLFGSMARGTARPDSDVDLAVLPARQRSSRTLDELPTDLEDRLSRALGRRVQVVDLRSAPADLIHRVLRDGILLLDRDPSRRIRFEVTARNRYFDMVPIWRCYRAGGRKA